MCYALDMVETLPLDEAQQEFRRLKPELDARHPGKAVVVGPDGLIGAFDTLREAMDAGSPFRPHTPLVTAWIPGEREATDEPDVVRALTCLKVESPDE